MKFWMSGEVDVDLNGSERTVRNKIQLAMIEALSGASIDKGIERWSFVSIILSERFLVGMPEILRKNSRRKELEFRLHVTHAEFKDANDQKQISMILNALERSVFFMDRFKVSKKDQHTFLDAINNVRVKLFNECSGI